MITLSKTTIAEQPIWEELYLKSFPEIERKPIKLLYDLQSAGKAMRLSIHDEATGEFVGLCYFLTYGNDILFDYFAILPEKQSQGYGANVLQVAAETFPGKRIFGEVEPVNPAADNARQRERRMNFYLRNGVKPTGIIVDLFGCELQLMYVGENAPTYEEYENFLTHIIGAEIVSKNVHFLRQEVMEQN